MKMLTGQPDACLCVVLILAAAAAIVSTPGSNEFFHHGDSVFLPGSLSEAAAVNDLQQIAVPP